MCKTVPMASVMSPHYKGLGQTPIPGTSRQPGPVPMNPGNKAKVKSVQLSHRSWPGSLQGNIRGKVRSAANGSNSYCHAYLASLPTDSSGLRPFFDQLSTYPGHVFKTVLGPAQVPSLYMYSDAVPFPGGASKCPERGQGTPALSPSLCRPPGWVYYTHQPSQNHHSHEQSAVCLAYDRTTFVKHTGTSYNNKLMLIFRIPVLAHYH